MKALLWNGSKALEYTELPSPRPAEDEAVVEIELAGICGSDLHPYRGHPGPRVPPLVLGHEAVARWARSLRDLPAESAAAPASAAPRARRTSARAGA